MRSTATAECVGSATDLHGTRSDWEAETSTMRCRKNLYDALSVRKKDNISINQFIALALAEKISALMTEDYLGERAKRGSRKEFERAMAKVPDVEPDERDRL